MPKYVPGDANYRVGQVRQNKLQGYPGSVIADLARMHLRRIQEERGDRDSAAVALGRENFEAFCGLIEIIPKSGPRCPLILNSIQKIFEINRTGRDIVLKPRQIGFTTLELARDLWLFLTREGSRVVVVCQSVTDNAPAKLISGVLRIMLEGLRKHGWIPTFLTESWNEWVLENGNSLRIVVAGASEASAAKKGRAGTITRLHMTETAFYEHADSTLNALLECVPGVESGSEIVTESTPNGAVGTFYRQCKSAQAQRSANKFHFYAWYAHPEYRVPLDIGEDFVPEDDAEAALFEDGVTLAQLKWRRQKVADKGKDHFDQEYPSDPESCFLTSGHGFFDKDRVAEDLAKVQAPIELRRQGRVRIFRRPDYTRRESFLLALDPSEGVDGDPGAGVMYDWSTGEHVATIDGQFPVGEIAVVAAALAKEYQNATLAVERNNHGHAVLLALGNPEYGSTTGEPMYHNIYKHSDGKEGFPTNLKTRPEMLDHLEDAHRKGVWSTRDHAILTQMRTFVVINGKPQASPGEHDDLVMAAAIGKHILQGGQAVFADAFEDTLSLAQLATFSAGGRGF